MQAQAVEGADRRLRVGHADVDVQAADRRRDGIAEQLADLLVALLVGDLALALLGRGMRAGAEQPDAGREHAGAQRCERASGLAGGRADVGDQLDLRGVQLALDFAGDGPEPALHGGRGVDLATAERIDEEQLLLDADRVGALACECVLDPDQLPATPANHVRRARAPAAAAPARTIRGGPYRARVARTRLYRDGKLELEDFPVADVSEHIEDPGATVWLDYCEPTTADLATIASELSLHPLAVEDAVNEHQRPKLDRYDTHLFLNSYVVHFDVGLGRTATPARSACSSPSVRSSPCARTRASTSRPSCAAGTNRATWRTTASRSCCGACST